MLVLLFLVSGTYTRSVLLVHLALSFGLEWDGAQFMWIWKIEFISQGIFYSISIQYFLLTNI